MDQDSLLKRLEDDHDQIADAIRQARAHLYWHTFLGLTLVALVAINLWNNHIMGKSVGQAVQMSQQTATSTAKIQAKQDLYRQQYLDYIKDMIAVMQSLQEANPQIKVPKAPVPRSPAQLDGEVTEEKLRRIPQTKPGPTPTPVVKTVVKKVVKVKVKTPTPKPFFQWFKHTR